MNQTVYTRISSDREKRFRVITKMIKENDGLVAIKAPENPQAKDFVMSLPQKYQSLCKKYEGKNIRFAEAKAVSDTEVSIEYFQGKGFGAYLDELLAEGDFEQACALMREYISLVLGESTPFASSEAFCEVFGDAWGTTAAEGCMCYDIDMIFDNVLYDANRRLWMVYDYEWLFDFAIPKDYCVYRMVSYYVTRSKYARTYRDALYQALEVDESRQELYARLEASFQAYVRGNDVTRNVIEEAVGNQFTSVVDLKEQLRLKENHIHNQEMMIQLYQIKGYKWKNRFAKVKAIMRKPLYGAKLVWWKLSKGKSTPYMRALQKRKNFHLTAAQDNGYENWIASVEASYETGETFANNPLISVIVPVYNVKDEYLIDCIESVRRQTYENWELCLADDASTWPSVRKILQSYENDPKIKIVYREENGHISKSTNSALELATGEFVAFLDCDDVLTDNALYEVVKLLNENPCLDLIYSDEDKVDEDGHNRHLPHFKPDWSPDTLMTHMYICHLAVYRRSIVEELGGLRPGLDGSQDYDLALRFTEKTSRIGHIPKILYHWREIAGSTAQSSDAKPYIVAATRRAKEDALLRRGLEGNVQQVGDTNWFHVEYATPGNPKVSILIPSKDNYDILSRCIRSIYTLTTYPNFEVVLIDNGSNEKNRALYQSLADEFHFTYHHEVMPFNFSAICNKAAGLSTGEYYLFLNDDTEVLEGRWLELMLGQAMLKHTGAVGAKLLYPETNRIQHVGVINIGDGPAHALLNFPDTEIYYFGRNAFEYNYAAVTGACLMLSAEKFHEVGGFDEGLAVAYNDVDLCFKLIEHGYYNVVRNDVTLLHYESVSRGQDAASAAKLQRLFNEHNGLYERHPMFYKRDPFYNPNLIQNNMDFSCAYTGFKSENEYAIYKGNLADKSLCCENHLECYSRLPETLKVKMTDMLMHIDDVEKKEHHLHVRGWFIFKGDIGTNNSLAFVTLKDAKGNIHVFNTIRQRRMDVQARYRGDYDLPGVDCLLNTAVLEAGVYEIGIAVYFAGKPDRLFISMSQRTVEIF